MSSEAKESKPPQSIDPFYVGYLPASQKHRTAMIFVICLISIWILLASLLIVLSQRSPGVATWDNSNEQTWSGLLINTPYPMLVTKEETLLVVSMGKAGAHKQLEPFFGTHVKIMGYVLQREGRRMIELSPDGVHPELIQNVIQIDKPELEFLEEEPSIYTGEIIDGKCFLGAMKPGDGFAHRSCAILCLKGGLPPMFVSEQDSNEALYPLIIIDGVAELPEQLHTYVACRIECKARKAKLGTLPLMLVEVDSIRALTNMQKTPRGQLIETAGG